MSAIYDFDALKKATNLGLNSDFLLNTRALNINFSATLEQALQEKLKTIIDGLSTCLIIPLINQKNLQGRTTPILTPQVLR